MALVRPSEMFSLWAKERWLRDGFCFISKSVSRCFLVDMEETSIRSSGYPVGQLKKILRINAKCKIVQLAGLRVNVQDVNVRIL